MTQQTAEGNMVSCGKLNEEALWTCGVIWAQGKQQIGWGGGGFLEHSSGLEEVQEGLPIDLQWVSPGKC